MSTLQTLLHQHHQLVTELSRHINDDNEDMVLVIDLQLESLFDEAIAAVAVTEDDISNLTRYLLELLSPEDGRSQRDHLICRRLMELCKPSMV